MKDYKFIGYDPGTKEIVTDFSSYHLDIENGRLLAGRFLKDGDFYEINLMLLFDEKDKNGITVFEGAILKGPYGTGMPSAKFTKYKDFFFVATLEDTEIHMDTHPFAKNTEQYRFHPGWDQCEIVGNIYKLDEIPGLTLLEPQIVK